MTELLNGVDSPSDAELISRVRGGDVASYGMLFSRHVDAARRLGRQLVRGPDAEDLVSDAFAKTLQVLQAGGGPDVAFRAYLLTSVRRLHVDRIRAAKKVQPSDDMTVYDDGQPFQDTAVASFENGAAAKAFSSLPERWQLVLWHLEVEGQKPADIAPLLGMSPNSVSALAYRAREGLRQAFLTMHLADCATEQCRWVNEHLGAYVRKGLSRRDTAKVEDHLEDCRRCTAMYLELNEVNSDLAGIIAPLLLGAAAAGYLTSGGVAGLTGVSAVLGRLRDAFSVNAGGGGAAATTGGAAAGGAATAGAAATTGGVVAGGVVAASVAAVATAAVVLHGGGGHREVVTQAEKQVGVVHTPPKGAGGPNLRAEATPAERRAGGARTQRSSDVVVVAKIQPGSSSGTSTGAPPSGDGHASAPASGSTSGQPAQNSGPSAGPSDGSSPGPGSGTQGSDPGSSGSGGGSDPGTGSGSGTGAQVSTDLTVLGTHVNAAGKLFFDLSSASTLPAEVQIQLTSAPAGVGFAADGNCVTTATTATCQVHGNASTFPVELQLTFPPGITAGVVTLSLDTPGYRLTGDSVMSALFTVPAKSGDGSGQNGQHGGDNPLGGPTAPPSGSTDSGTSGSGSLPAPGTGGTGSVPAPGTGGGNGTDATTGSGGTGQNATGGGSGTDSGSSPGTVTDHGGGSGAPGPTTGPGAGTGSTSNTGNGGGGSGTPAPTATAVLSGSGANGSLVVSLAHAPIGQTRFELVSPTGQSLPSVWFTSPASGCVLGGTGAGNSATCDVTSADQTLTFEVHLPPGHVGQALVKVTVAGKPVGKSPYDVTSQH